MAASKQLDLVLTQGKTYTKIIRLEKEPFIYVPINAIDKTAPVEIHTQGPHGLTDGWRAAVVSVQGMREINAKHKPPRGADFHRVTVINPTQVEINEINAAEFSTYTSGGFLQTYTPVDLAGATARLVVKDRVGGTELLRLTPSSGIAIDNALKTITITIDAITSAAFTWSNGVYEFEVQSVSGVVTGIYVGEITILKEIAT